MPQTFEERKRSVEGKIKTLEKQILLRREKMKKLQGELKSLIEEEDKNYADTFLKLITENGIISEADRMKFLNEIEKAAKNAAIKSQEKNENQQNDENQTASENSENEQSAESKIEKTSSIENSGIDEN